MAANRPRSEGGRDRPAPGDRPSSTFDDWVASAGAERVTRIAIEVTVRRVQVEYPPEESSVARWIRRIDTAAITTTTLVKQLIADVLFVLSWLFFGLVLLVILAVVLFP